MKHNGSLDTVEALSLLNSEIRDHESVISAFDDDIKLTIVNIANEIKYSFNKGGRLFLCGNGGSAADSQHIAAEFVGRFRSERRPLPAIALTTDTSALTAIGNDYSFNEVFSRQLDALASEHDVLIAISTSGNSQNILRAIEIALKRNCKVIGLTGGNGGSLTALCDFTIAVPSFNTARIQETHILIGHLICSLIDSINWGVN